MEDRVHRITAHFKGRVQGVGFRYQTLNMAKNFEVSGFVRNLPDGRVELVVEGERIEAERMIAELAEQMAFFIRGIDQEAVDEERAHSGFSVR